MTKKRKKNILVNDTVQVISGFYKNKIGRVREIYTNPDKVLVEGINYKFKHIKPNAKNEVGQIKQIEAPIHRSNVKLFIEK
jgi:large subunit ribosomal protein L24